MRAMDAALLSLADRIDAVLPQTQCTRCGFAACRPYAEALAAGTSDINRCPPGGDAVVATLATLTGRATRPLDPDCGAAGPLLVAVIDEAACIGCTLCIAACPVDAIVGAQKRMHAVLPSLCSGCELCVAPCPVDCIALLPAERAWTADDAAAARAAGSSGAPRASPATSASSAAPHGRPSRRTILNARGARPRSQPRWPAHARAAAPVHPASHEPDVMTQRTTQAMRSALVLALLLKASIAMSQTVPDFSERLDKLWDYSKPAESQQRFVAEKAKHAAGSREALETATQIARTQGLQRKFAEADATLDTVMPGLDKVPVRVHVRYLLERGRTRNSGGDKPAAMLLFSDALALSERDKLPGADFYRVDTLHMLAIASKADAQLDWNRRALAAAEASSDVRARGWMASLCNNIGWTYFDAGDAATALDVLEEGLAAARSAGQSGQYPTGEMDHRPRLSGDREAR